MKLICEKPCTSGITKLVKQFLVSIEAWVARLDPSNPDDWVLAWTVTAPCDSILGYYEIGWVFYRPVLAVWEFRPDEWVV